MARTKKLDFTGVKSYSKVSEGVHTAKVVEIEEKVSQGGDDMLQFTFEVMHGNDKGGRVFESFVLTDKALWKFKAFLQSIGMKADGKIKLDLDKLIGKVCDIEVFWEEYNGQTRSKIADYFKVGKAGSEPGENEADDDEDEEEEETSKKPAKRGRKAKKAEPEPSDDEDEEEEEEEDDDEEEEPEKPAKRGRKAKTEKPAKRGRKAKKPEPEPEEEDEDDEDDDEWEEDDD